MSRDNASQRILSPRDTAQGSDSSLKNTYGATLINGAQCFVIEEEANYRFLKHSVLHADGRFVVEPIDRSGRWVRESGTFGVAMLKGGVPQKSDPLLIGSYDPQLLVQFALSEAKLVYTGNVPRLACIMATAPGRDVRGEILRGKETLFFWPEEPVTLIVPGDCLSLYLVHPLAADAVAPCSLTVVLG